MTDPFDIKKRILSSVDVTPDLSSKVSSGGKLNLVKALRLEVDQVTTREGHVHEGEILDFPDMELDGEFSPMMRKDILKLVPNFPAIDNKGNAVQEKTGIHRFTTDKPHRNGDSRTIRHVRSKATLTSKDTLTSISIRLNNNKNKIESISIDDIADITFSDPRFHQNSAE